MEAAAAGSPRRRLRRCLRAYVGSLRAYTPRVGSPPKGRVFWRLVDVERINSLKLAESDGLFGTRGAAAAVEHDR